MHAPHCPHNRGRDHARIWHLHSCCLSAAQRSPPQMPGTGYVRLRRRTKVCISWSKHLPQCNDQGRPGTRPGRFWATVSESRSRAPSPGSRGRVCSPTPGTPAGRPSSNDPQPLKYEICTLTKSTSRRENGRAYREDDFGGNIHTSTFLCSVGFSPPSSPSLVSACFAVTVSPRRTQQRASRVQPFSKVGSRLVEVLASSRAWRGWPSIR